MVVLLALARCLMAVMAVTVTDAGLCSEPGAATTDGGLAIYCILVDGELHDVYQITNGTTTCGANDANSCPDGMDIWVPRSYDHAKAVYGIYGLSGTGLAGVYRSVSGCGSCTSYAMNSDAMASYSGVGWTSVAPTADPWFLRA